MEGKAVGNSTLLEPKGESAVHKPLRSKMVLVYLGTLLLTLPIMVSANAVAPSNVKSDEYTFQKLGPSVVVVLHKGEPVAQITVANGKEQVDAFAGIDEAKIKTLYDDYLASNSQSHGGGNGANATGSGGIRFDDAGDTITVPLGDGTTVVFSGNDVKITGEHPGLGYVLRYQKGGVRRFLERFGTNHADNLSVGGGITGGGYEFLSEKGDLIYDAGMGAIELQENPRVVIAKRLANTAVDAVARVQHVSGHESFEPPGYSGLKKIAEFKLRADGSR